MKYLAESAATHWYTNGTFLGVVGVAVGVASVILAIVLWWLGTPRGVLEFSMPTVKSIVSRSRSLQPDDLQVSVRGKVVQNPCVATLRIANKGRRDIRRSDFDQDKPLRLCMGVPVIQILSSPSHDEESFSFEGLEVILVPTLIRRGRKFSINVLTEGYPQEPVCTHELIDIRVRPLGGPRPSYRSALLFALPGVPIGAYLVCLTTCIELFNHVNRSHLVFVYAIVGMVCFLLSGPMVFLASWLTDVYPHRSMKGQGS
jgi:hypothetical protein